MMSFQKTDGTTFICDTTVGWNIPITCESCQKNTTFGEGFYFVNHIDINEPCRVGYPLCQFCHDVIYSV